MFRLLVTFFLVQWFSNFSIYENGLESLFLHRFPGPTPIIADTVHLGWDPASQET